MSGLVEDFKARTTVAMIHTGLVAYSIVYVHQLDLVYHASNHSRRHPYLPFHLHLQHSLLGGADNQRVTPNCSDQSVNALRLSFDTLGRMNFTASVKSFSPNARKS